MKNRLKWSINAFTLPEVVLAIALLALAAAAGFDALRAARVRLGAIQENAERQSDQAIALALLGKDLRCAILPEDDPASLFIGSKRLDFSRTGVSGDAGSGDTVEVGYFLEPEAGTGIPALWRWTENRTALLCPYVTDFELRYFDGETWSDRWGWDEENKRPVQGIRGLPLMVSVRLNGTTVVFPVMTALLNRGGA